MIESTHLGKVVDSQAMLEVVLPSPFVPGPAGVDVDPQTLLLPAPPVPQVLTPVHVCVPPLGGPALPGQGKPGNAATCRQDIAA